MTNSYPPKRPEWSNSKFVNRPKEKLWLDRNECRNHKTISLIEQLSLASVNEHICSKYLDLGFLYNSLYSAYQIKESKVCFTNGADGAIRIFYEFLMTSGNNHNCYLMRPSYGMYEVYSRNYCKNTEFIDYEPFVNGNSNVFNILIKTLESAPSKSSFILANPESPTGLEFDNHQIEKIISVCERKGIYFLLDETYKSFGSRPSPLFIDEIISPFLFQVISFSKSWGLSGFRIGCLNSNESNMRLIKRTRPMYEIGSFQATLMAKCFDNRFLLEKYCIDTTYIRSRMVNLLNDLGIISHNTKSNFLHINKLSLTLNQFHWFDDNISYKTYTHSSLTDLIRMTVPSEDEMSYILSSLTNLR